jgi:signal transduction histidine kinase
MKQLTACVMFGTPACGSWLIRIILVFSVLVSILTCHGQDQNKIDSLENVMRNAREDTSLVNAMTSLSYNYMMNSSFEKALQYADSAVALSEKLKYIKGQANAYFQKGRLLIDIGNYPAALESLQLSLKYAEETVNKKMIARAYDNIGLAYLYMDHYPEALKNCSTALKILEETGSKKGMADNYDNIGKIYAAQNKYPEAAEMYFSSIKIMEEIGDKNGLAVTYTNLGMLYSAQINYPEALKMYFACLEIDKESGYKYGMIYDYNNIASIMVKQGNIPEAIEMFRHALKISEEIRDTVNIIDLSNNIGFSYTKLENYKEAEAYFNSSLELAYKIEYYEEGITATHAYLGNLFSSQDKFAQADKHFLAAMEIYKETENLYKVATQYNRLGHLYFLASDFEKARKHLEEGLFMSHQLEFTRSIHYSYKYLYKLDSAEGRFSRALENYKLYALYSDSLMGEASKQQVESMKIQYETEKKDKEIELLNKDNEIKSLQLSRQKAVRHGMIAGIVLLFLTGFLLFRSFRLRKKLEQQQAIISERKRISADLHDDVGSGLSRIMLLTELVKKEAKTPEMQKEASKIASISKELSANISEIIWALNANNDYLESLVAYIRRYAAEFFDDSAVKLRINSTGTITGIPISGELRREIFYTVKEALHNIYKHAQASEAELSFSVENEVLTVAIQDNGIGMPEKDTGRYGNGLNNMQQRMAAVGGSLNIENHNGTKIKLTVPGCHKH